MTVWRSKASIANAIIEPAHTIAPGDPNFTTEGGASRMGNYSHALTVKQLADLIAFLQDGASPDG